MKSNQAYASIPTVLPAAERSEAERSEGERSGAAGKTVAAPGAVPGSIARRQHTSAPGAASMIRVPLSGSTKSLVAVPSRTAQSG